MYVRDLVASLRRRWYFLLAGVLVTAGLCAVAARGVQPSYEVSGSMLLLPPKSSVGPRGNPYLYLGGLGQAVEVLSARLNAPEFRRTVDQAQPRATWTAAQDATTTGPILAVDVTAPTEREARDTAALVMAGVPESLTAMQDQLGVGATSRIGVLVLIPGSEVVVLTKTRDRAVIAAAGAGLAATVLLTGFLDGWLVARRPRVSRPRDPAPGWVLGSGPEPVPPARTVSGAPTRERQPVSTSAASS